MTDDWRALILIARLVFMVFCIWRAAYHAERGNTAQTVFWSTGWLGMVAG